MNMNDKHIVDAKFSPYFPVCKHLRERCLCNKHASNSGFCTKPCSYYERAHVTK